MELFGQPSHLVTAGSLVDERRDHEDIDAFQVFVRVHEAGAVFKPDLPLVDVWTFPLGQRSGKKEHSLPGYGYVFKVPTG